MCATILVNFFSELFCLFFDRNGWGNKQNVLFDKVIKVLSNLRLSRLTYEGVSHAHFAYN